MSRRCEFCSKPSNCPKGRPFTCPYCGKTWRGQVGQQTLDEKLDALAYKVEAMVRKTLKPPNDSYHRTYLKALVHILKRRGEI